MAVTQSFEIDVKGEVEILLPAERALLSVTVNTQGQDKAKVTDGVVTSARKVEATLRKICAQKENQTAAVDYWSRTSLSEHSHVPYDNERKINLPREYQATVDFEVRLQRFNRLGPVIHELVAIEHVGTKAVEWVLTAETKEAQRSKLRTLAAKNALSKAQDYAKALGYDKVVAFEIKEAQQYTRSSSRKSGWAQSDGVETQSKNMADTEDWEDVGEQAFQYTPEEVKMSQSVNAKFRAE